jgi:indolepyruvate ferredoxin oxidoreductase beta subunit
MKIDIILAGVGGQGILSIASIIDLVALKEKYYIKQAEIHGMSQRGGAVQSHLRISSKPVHSDLISEGCADMILSVEPLESLRYLNFLSQSGVVITSVDCYKNIPDYPDEKLLMNELNKLKNIRLVEATKLAKEAGSTKASNIVMLGAASKYFDISTSSFEDAISVFFKSKGTEIVELNKKAYNLGLNLI